MLFVFNGGFGMPALAEEPSDSTVSRTIIVPEIKKTESDRVTSEIHEPKGFVTIRYEGVFRAALIPRGTPDSETYLKNNLIPFLDEGVLRIPTTSTGYTIIVETIDRSTGVWQRIYDLPVGSHR